MTLNEFLIALKGTRNGWTFIPPYKRLRKDSGASNVCCPITAVCLHLTGKYFDPIEYENAADLIKLGEDEMGAIVDAADCSRHLDDHPHGRLREQLIDATDAKTE